MMAESSVLEEMGVRLADYSASSCGFAFCVDVGGNPDGSYQVEDCEKGCLC